MLNISKIPYLDCQFLAYAIIVIRKKESLNKVHINVFEIGLNQGHSY